MPPGFRRSRALWDEARRPNAPRCALLRAILYELQPVRFSAIDISAITASLRFVWSGSVSFVTETVPSIARGSYSFVRNMTSRHWMAVAGVIVYYNVVRWVHRMLDAGPILVIITALVAIFTIGLGDTASQDGVSAYSVFNRGFERILGSVDVEALVQQHVGGAMGLAAAGLPEPEQEAIQRQPVARRPQPRNDNDDDENVAHATNGDANDNNASERETSRKSGKKARRRNLEQKRELQRQREAAMAMGFTGNEGEEEMMAMQRLLEEQIAANNRQEQD